MRSVPLLLLVTLAALPQCDGNLIDWYEQLGCFRAKSHPYHSVSVQEHLEVDYPYKLTMLFFSVHIKNRFKHRLREEGIAEGLFSVDETGGFYVHEPFDREEKSSYSTTIYVLDNMVNFEFELLLSVHIVDINDNPPTFANSTMTADLKENMEKGFLPVQLNVADRDQGKNSEIAIRVVSQNPPEPKIGSPDLHREPLLNLMGCFDYDKVKQYELLLEAKDGGTPALSSTAVLILNIFDANNYRPMFTERKYHAEALEKTVYESLLRLAVEDKDTPYTDSWLAKYFFIEGNEEGIFKLETDPETNEGILSVTKGLNFDLTTWFTLQIGVENIEPLFVCKDGKSAEEAALMSRPDSVSVTVRMIDTYGPPVFDKQVVQVYQWEEAEPGQVLFVPTVQDEDSNNFRFVLAEDPAGWLSIDETTGQVSVSKKMDRESSFVDLEHGYRAVVAVIDDGEPPATGTSLLQVFLGDINDNVPTLVTRNVTMCANRMEKVMVSAQDPDAFPYTGPFYFYLEDDEVLKEQWKLDRLQGEEVGLVPLKNLPSGKYLVPLVIQDLQNKAGRDTLEVLVVQC